LKTVVFLIFSIPAVILPIFYSDFNTSLLIIVTPLIKISFSAEHRVVSGFLCAT